MRYHPLYQLTLSKVRELLREPEALFWIFIFPLLLALVLGIAFRHRGPEVLPVGVVEGVDATWVEQALAAAPGLEPTLLTPAEAHLELRSGKVALVVLPAAANEDSWTYWYDPSRPDSRLARLAVDDTLQRAAGRRDPRPAANREMTERGSRYIDFLIPGLLGLNLMGTGMWGIGFSIVNARSKRLLKRLVATPMRRSDYLLGQVAGRLVFLVLEVTVLLAFARYALGVPVRGSLLTLAFVTLVGAFTFSGLGLLVASRARTVEGVSGLMNFVMLPMWVMSGIFFSTSRFPDALQPVVQALPLTAVINALRSVMVDGAGLATVAGEVALAAIWAAVSFAFALKLFRWS